MKVIKRVFGRKMCVHMWKEVKPVIELMFRNLDKKAHFANRLEEIAMSHDLQLFEVDVAPQNREVTIKRREVWCLTCVNNYVD